MAQQEQTRMSEPLERLKAEARGLAGAMGDRAVSSLRQRVEDTTGRLGDYAEGNGSGLAAALTGAKGLAEGKSPMRAMAGAGLKAAKDKVAGAFGKKGGGAKKVKLTNIVESIDVGVPISVAYNQWTQFTDFPRFMKKVENVEQAEDQKLNWKAQVFWSHRTWEATILDQVPDDRIVFRSKGAKGYVDGAVTFHELASNLTRILVVLEYHPQGLFEHTGNIWRAQGRRVRLELKHFRRYVMTESILKQDEIDGWRGEIHDSEVSEGSGDDSSANGSGKKNGEKKASENARSEDGAARQPQTRGRRTAASGSSRSSGSTSRTSGSSKSAGSRSGERRARASSSSSDGGESRSTRTRSAQAAGNGTQRRSARTSAATRGDRT